MKLKLKYAISTAKFGVRLRRGGIFEGKEDGDTFIINKDGKDIRVSKSLVDVAI